MGTKSLQLKPIHEIRGIAQSLGVNDIFEKDKIALIQEIELKQKDMIPEKPKLPEIDKFDAALMDKAPAEMASPSEVVRLLEKHIELGLQLKITDTGWIMSFGTKSDSGTIRMPLKTILACANRLMI